jgi:hypothetical protein
MNPAHGSRQHRQRLKMFLPANAHCPAMRLTEKSLNQRGEMSIKEERKMRIFFTAKKRSDANFTN